MQPALFNLIYNGNKSIKTPMTSTTTLGPSDENDPMRVYEKYAEDIRPYYVILDFFDTVHPVFNCDLARILVSYVPDLRKTPRVHTATLTTLYNVLCVDGITEDLCIDLPPSFPVAGLHLRIYIGSVGSFKVHIRCHDSRDRLQLGCHRYRQISSTTGNDTICLIPTTANFWISRSPTPNWSGTLLEY